MYHWERQALKRTYNRLYTSTPTVSTPLTSPFAPRHLLSCADLSANELKSLIRMAYSFKQELKTQDDWFRSRGQGLLGKSVAMLFSKRSTRTRVSTESAVAALGGSSMFLGKDDIQLGVNESLKDTSIVISSMVASIVARVAKHDDVADLTKHSTVPVINALSDDFHPLQAITDCLTLYETFGNSKNGSDLGLEGLRIAWVGDANNVLFDLAIAARKLGINLAVAAPKGYQTPERMVLTIKNSAKEGSNPGDFVQLSEPYGAVKDAQVIFTDTWISMGQEDEKEKRLKAFEGFRVSESMAEEGGAQPDWRFMHCLPRHPEEVTDEVFYHPQRSLVFTEAENRLYTMIAVLHAFVVLKGKFV